MQIIGSIFKHIPNSFFASGAEPMGRSVPAAAAAAALGIFFLSTWPPPPPPREIHFYLQQPPRELACAIKPPRKLKPAPPCPHSTPARPGHGQAPPPNCSNRLCEMQRREVVEDTGGQGRRCRCVVTEGCVVVKEGAACVGLCMTDRCYVL